MSKKSKGKKREEVKKPAPPPPGHNPEETDRDENPFDFGGLPQRDLKKNLGCG